MTTYFRWNRIKNRFYDVEYNEHRFRADSHVKCNDSKGFFITLMVCLACARAVV